MLEKLKKVIPTESKMGFWVVGDYGDFEMEFKIDENFTDDDVIFIHQFILFSKNFDYFKPCKRISLFTEEEMAELSDDPKKQIIFEICKMMYQNDYRFDDINSNNLKIFFHEKDVGVHQIDLQASELYSYAIDESIELFEDLLLSMEDKFIIYKFTDEEDMSGDNEYCSDDSEED